MKNVNFVFRYGVGNEAKQICKDAIYAQLFVSGWELAPAMVECIEQKAVLFYHKRRYYLTSAVYDNDKIVGICLVRGNWIMVFVHPEYRGHKLSKSLIDLLIEKYHIDKYRLIAGIGTIESIKLWKQYPFIHVY